MTECGQAMFMISMGMADFCPNNDCGPRVLTNGVREVLAPLTRDPNTGRLGYRYTYLEFNENWEGPDDMFKKKGGFLSASQDRFTNCLSMSGLDQDATANFDREDADLINNISISEGVPQNLLAITWRYETVFNMHPLPNTNNDSGPYRWDVGPFHINVRWTYGDAEQGRISFDGLEPLAVFGGRAYGGAETQGNNPNYGKPGPFDGVPLQNGRMAARRLNAYGGNDKNKAMKYAPPDHYDGKGKKRKWVPSRTFRGQMYDKWSGAWANFFNCYNS